ncbi:hypothetical protein ACP4OV_028147 [Aristida adscensionis]
MLVVLPLVCPEEDDDDHDDVAKKRREEDAAAAEAGDVDGHSLRARRAPDRRRLPPLRPRRQRSAGRVVLVGAAAVEELVPADERVRGRVAVVATSLDPRLVGWRQGTIARRFRNLSANGNSIGKEHALVISNHRGDIDWIIGWILAQRSGCLGSALGVMKKSLKFLPERIMVIGWSWWFAEYLFLEGSWAKDQNIIKSGLERLRGFPRSFWLCLFVEGTRFTPAKLLAAQEYAVAQGLPAPKNVLIPRTKGFVSAVSIMRDFVPAIYDATLITPKDSPAPTLLRIFKGQSSVVHVHIKRYAMSDLPRSDEDVSKWCKDIFVAKDALLDKHRATGAFGDEIRPIVRSMKSLLAACGSVLVVPPGTLGLQILTVDAAVVNMERNYPLCRRIGAGDCQCHYAYLHHSLSVRALKLY